MAQWTSRKNIVLDTIHQLYLTITVIVINCNWVISLYVHAILMYFTIIHSF
jgi:hypothetical protein